MRKIVLAAALVGTACVAAFADNSQLSKTTSSALSVPAVSGLPSEMPGQPLRARQLAKLVFASPVRVMNVWLQGTYLVEHDGERMARGEPCTHIYRINQKKPVVTFFCEHLHRNVADRGTVTLKRVGIMPATFELVEFQFEGSADAHGVPQTR